MLRALSALLFAVLPAAAFAQTEPPPDTKPARERHRLESRLPPPPQAPWGPEEFGFIWENPVWRGLYLHGGSFSGGSIGLDLPRGKEVSSDGISPPVVEELEYDEERFRSVVIGATADLDVLRLSFSWFDGTFTARGTLTLDDGFTAPQPRDVELNGDLYGFRIGAHWPGFRYRDTLFEASLGLKATVGWMHQEVDTIPGATLLRRDSADILTGSLGPVFSARIFLGRFALEGNAEYSFMTGAARGWVKELTVGASFKF
jgi:hypothetical protein